MVNVALQQTESVYIPRAPGARFAHELVARDSLSIDSVDVRLREVRTSEVGRCKLDLDRSLKAHLVSNFEIVKRKTVRAFNLKPDF